MSTAGHDHGHEALAHNDRKTGPAKIATLAGRYGGELSARYRTLKGLVRQTVESADALRLNQDALASPRGDFGFDDDDRKEAAFMRWFRQAQRDEVLEPVGDAALRNGRHYTAKYVRSTYRGGLRHAGRELRAAGVDVPGDAIEATFRAPTHTDQLRTLYRRQFTALEGITSAVDTEVSRTLTEGLLAGENPRTVARDLNGRADSIGVTRGRVLARTELSRSYNAAAAGRYQEYGVKMVEILVSDPCPTCEALRAGGPYPVEKAAGLIPGRTHPSCVCSISPVIPEALSRRRLAEAAGRHEWHEVKRGEHVRTAMDDIS